MRILVNILIAVSCLLLFSCKKYLDKKNNNSLVIPSTIADLQMLLDDGTIMNIARTPSFGEASADDYFMLQSTYDARNEREKSAYIWQPIEYYYENDWSKAYAAVYNANYCLDALESIDVNNANRSEWNNVKGSALFYRAYYFLQLTWTHCKAYDEDSSATDLGIVLRLNSDFNSPSVRASVKESYERIIKDGMESIQYLPNVGLHVFRPSKVAAYGLLARTYLSMRKYDSAFKYADLYLSIKNDLIDCNETNTDDFATPTSSFPFKKLNKETAFYSEMYLAIGNLSSSRIQIDTTLYASYSDDDLRKTAFFAPRNGYYNFKGSYSASLIYFTGIATDEMYLIRAECYARRNNPDMAMEDLNYLLSKRMKTPFTPLTAVDANDALSKVLIERRKELLLRGVRWSDIKRLNKEGAGITLQRIINGQTYILHPNAPYFALPLPADIVQLTGIAQNPL